MFIKKFLLLSVLVAPMWAPAAWAAVPASGELSDTARLVEWDGSGPYVFPNVTPAGGAENVVCEPAVPQVCDVFELTVNVSDDFRGLEENQRESVRIAIAFDAPTGQEDYDLYVHDAAGNLVGESATGGQEAITVPLKSLKNGSYTVTVIPFATFGTNYSGAVQIGKNAKTGGADSFGGAFGGALFAALAALAALRRSLR